MSDNLRIERMILMAERLTAALEGDIAALKAGTPQAMKTLDPEIQKLSALYGREAQGFNADAAKDTRADLRKKLKETTSRFRDVLGLHARLLSRMKNASEGIVKAVAEEVDRKNNQARPYAPGFSAAPRPASALVYNSVI